MPRPKSSVPTYRKHSSGNARVTVNGPDYLLGPHGSKASKREYDRLVAEYLASGRCTRPHGDESPATVPVSAGGRSELAVTCMDSPTATEFAVWGCGGRCQLASVSGADSELG